MKPYSKEWYAREKAWSDKCERNYNIAARVLVEEGYTKVPQQNKRPFPFLFVKADDTVYLGRQLGSSKWYPVPLTVSNSF
jgi:hypothetical protein